MNSSSPEERPYMFRTYNKHNDYKFCSGFDDVKIKEELQEFKHYSHHYLPSFDKHC
jgi:hypothetical protein